MDASDRDILMELNTITADDNTLFFVVNESMRDWFDTRFFANAVPASGEQRRFYRQLFPVVYDLEQCFLIVEKINWLTEHYCDETLPKLRWEQFVGTDIHGFHMEFRSLMDSIVHALKVFANKTETLPDSFSDLRKKCLKQSDRMTGLLGNEVVDLISRADWFQEARGHRDEIAHHRTDAIVRLNRSNRIEFNLVFAERGFEYTGPKEFVVDDGWLLLDAYVGNYLGRVFYLLEQICKLAAHRFKITPLNPLPWRPEGYSSAVAWVQKAIEELSQP